MSQHMGDTSARGVLQGIRVLDFGRYIAGPFCGALLADLGADVIRIEKIGGSEDRYLGPIAPSGEGALFLQCNRGKRGMTLDPMKPAGREIVHKLVQGADVVIANLPRQTLAAMGLDYETLARARAEIVVATLDAFGPEGPWADRIGFDSIGQAMSGAMFLSGEPSTPMKAAVPYVDFFTALSATTGILAALLERARTGKGQEVRASLLRSALTLGNGYLAEQAVLRLDRVACGNRSQLSGPSDAFRTRDGWIVVHVIGQPLFERWARAVGATQLLTDARFTSDADRGRYGAALSECMAAWCHDRSTDEVLAVLDAAGVPAAPVLSPEEALHHPQITGSGYLVPTRFGETEVPIAVTPFGLGGSRSEVRGPAPWLGSDTDGVLRELGYAPEQIAALRQDGVI
jgi:crotonobetainyl-CoA:carnitine CoA-transferase CaiB-like acyl-CoA transferase